MTKEQGIRMYKDIKARIESLSYDELMQDDAFHLKEIAKDMKLYEDTFTQEQQATLVAMLFGKEQVSKYVRVKSNEY